MRVLSNASADAAQRTLGELESAEQLFRNLVDVTPSLPVRAYAVKDADSLRELAPQFWQRRGIRPHALAYAGPYAAFLAVREDLAPAVRRVALLHEYVHILTASQVPDAPAWLDEGLAEFWGNVVIEGDRAIVGRQVKRHANRLRTWEPLQRTLDRKRGEFIRDSEPSEMFYAQSWAMVHYLIIGRSPAGPLTFAPDYRWLPPDIESGLRDYVSRGEFREVSVPFTVHPSFSHTASFLPESRSLAERAHMLVFGPRPDAAVTLAKRSLAIEPREALALEVMGTYHFLHNRHDEARDWLTRAFETGQASPAAAVYLALLATSNTDKERYLTAAVSAQPDLDIAWERLLALYRADGRLDALRRLCHLRSHARLALLQLAHDPICG